MDTKGTERNAINSAKWAEVLDAFRMMAFRVAYTHTLARVADPGLRFIRALQLSSRPIPDDRRPEVIAWYHREHPTCPRQTGHPGKRRPE
jgi:hypothetical protein